MLSFCYVGYVGYVGYGLKSLAKRDSAAIHTLY
jgi:hypothetical protein